MDIYQLKSTCNGVKEIIEEIDQLMISLYPECEGFLLPLDQLDLPNVYFAGAYIRND